MTFIQASLWGLLEALTEIFPLSRAAHVAMLERIFHLQPPQGAYDLVIQTGIFLAVLLFFGRDVLQMLKESPALAQFFFVKNKPAFFSGCQYALTLSLVLVAFLATGLIYFLLLEVGRQCSHSYLFVGAVWTLMGILLIRSSRFAAARRTAYEMNHQDSFVLGIVQGLMVFLGVSRSGITTVTALKLGIEAKEAVRFSFLMSIPCFIYSLAVKLSGRISFYDANQPALLAAFVVSFLTALGAINFVMFAMEKKKYHLFGFYCLIAGILVLGYHSLKVFLK